MMGTSGKRELRLGGEPRVQLLPAEVREREKLRETRQLLVLLVLLAGAVVFAGVVFGFFRSATAQAALAAAHAETERILAEQAEYAEVGQIASFVDAGTQAQRLVTSNEYDWLNILGDLAAYLPGGASIQGISFTAPAPWEAPLVAEGPLRAERTGIVQLTIASENYATAAAFAGAVAAYEGAADVVITGSMFDETQYLTTVVITLNPSVRSDRFEPEEATEEDAGADDTDATATTEESR